MGAQMVYLREPVTNKEVEDGSANPGSECLQFGVCAMQGWRRNMEDAHMAVLELDKGISFFGVFDGHGGRGVSKFAAKHLPSCLRETEEFQKGEYARALEKAFLRIDEKLREDAGRREIEALDRPEPGAASHPIVVPRRVLQRFLGNAGGGPAEDSDEEEDGGKSEKAGDEGEANGKENGKESADAKEGQDAAKAPEKAEKAGGEAADEADDLEDEVQLDEDDELAEDGDDQADGDVENEDPEWGDEEMALVDPSRLTRDPSPEAQGCTAVAVLMVRREEGSRLFCANAGDSRAVLSRSGKVVALSEDHKPENPEETARITKAGGTVQHMPGGARVMGDLNLSRAMGDLRYKKPEHLPPAEQILTVFPEVREFDMSEEDEFMVIGCDGIWERIDNQGVVDFVGPRLAAKEGADKPALSSICAEICDRGLCPSMDMGENSSFDGTGCDNMTVMVVQLKSQVTDPSRKRPAEGPAEGDGLGESKKQKEAD